MELEIRVASDRSDDDLVALSQWLRRERGLSSAVNLVRAKQSDDALGGAWELLTAAVGSGGTFAVLAASLDAWLRTRRRPTTIRLTRGDNSIEIDGKNVGDLKKLFEMLGEPKVEE
ncbi:effector-associated constant component EACC1 [Nocardia inohanensis]|uniref:effector-associated constant component EACC1 n=1 Tax=Nocardia inohanensis TaxID=209246 RepID=UPI0012FAB438|nr:hypothetical protein [Nocardia inohanensis]